MDSATISPPVVTPRSYCDFLEGIPGWVRTNRSALFIARVKTVSLFHAHAQKRAKFFVTARSPLPSAGHGRAALDTVQTTNSQFSLLTVFNQTALEAP